MSRDQDRTRVERFEKAKVLVGKRYVSEAGAAVRSGTVRETGPGPHGLAMEDCAQGLGVVERSRHSYCMIDRVRGWDGSWSLQSYWPGQSDI